VSRDLIAREGISRKRVNDCYFAKKRGEISLTKSRGRNRSAGPIACAIARPAVVEEVKGPIFSIVKFWDDHWAAVVHRKHVVVFKGGFSRIIPGPSVEPGIEVTPVEAAMQLVRAGFTNHRKLGDLGILRRVIGRHDLYFLVTFDVPSREAIRRLA